MSCCHHRSPCTCRAVDAVTAIRGYAADLLANHGATFGKMTINPVASMFGSAFFFTVIVKSATDIEYTFNGSAATIETAYQSAAIYAGEMFARGDWV